MRISDWSSDGCSSDLLRDYDGPTETYPRVEQIFNWAGPDFQGIMAFDESQEMRNAAGQEDVSGKSEVSKQGLAGVELQNVLQDARVIYASATGATDVHNLAYATRLGMWRSKEHTSELPSLMRISYAVFCL